MKYILLSVIKVKYSQKQIFFNISGITGYGKVIGIVKSPLNVDILSSGFEH